MTAASRLVDLICDDREPTDCGACAGLGLRCTGADESPELCWSCGGSGLGREMIGTAVVARSRAPMTDAELDQEAEDFARALLAGIERFEREQGWAD